MTRGGAAVSLVCGFNVNEEGEDEDKSAPGKREDFGWSYEWEGIKAEASSSQFTFSRAMASESNSVA